MEAGYNKIKCAASPCGHFLSLRFFSNFKNGGDTQVWSTVRHTTATPELHNAHIDTSNPT